MYEFDILTSIYSKFFGSEFDGADFDQRILMQKIVYLLSENGIECGEYNFIWYKRGPFSNNLHLSIYEISKKNYEKKSIEFDSNTLAIIEKIKSLYINKPSIEGDDYSVASWYEAFASIHYLKNYYFPTKNKQEIISILERLKDHLNKRFLNNYAYDSISSL